MKLEKLTATYHQESDANSTEDQFLEISTEDAGGGQYFSIKTERWAFDTIDELIKVLKDFEKRLK